MFVLFGVMRLPSVVLSLVEIFMSKADLDSFDRSTFAGFSAFLAQFSGVPLFFWFATKFNYVGLWREYFRGGVNDEIAGGDLGAYNMLREDGEDGGEYEGGINRGSEASVKSNRSTKRVVETLAGVF